MKTYSIEQAKYDLRWHKSEEQSKSFGPGMTICNASPACFHVSIRDDNQLVAFITRPSYKEALQMAKEFCRNEET
jgi:hypothetical protein